MQKIHYDKLFLSINLQQKDRFWLGATHIFIFKSCQSSEQGDNDQINGMVLVYRDSYCGSQLPEVRTPRRSMGLTLILVPGS